MKIFLCGFSGAGKTSLANKFKNNQLGYSIYDLDNIICEKLAISDSELGDWIKHNGVEEFRKIEEETLYQLVITKGDFVVSLGGGALNGKTLSLIKSLPDSRLIFLNVPFEICYERIKNDTNRLLSEISYIELKKIFDQRMPLYLKADLYLLEKEIKEIDGLERLVHNLN